MNKNNDALIFQIDGRNVLPVRTLPFVTGGQLPPDEVALHFAQHFGDESGFARLRNTRAYRVGGGVITPMHPKEWDRVVAAMQGLEAELHAKYGKASGAGYSEWQSASISLLPAGVFVWREEFEKDYAVDLSEDRVSFNSFFRFTKEREGERALTYAPWLPDGVRPILIAGFEKMAISAPSTDQVKSPESSTHMPSNWKERARLIALKFMDRHRGNDLFPTQRDVAEYLEREFRKQGILSPNKKALSAAYIKRNAIQGEWWQKARNGTVEKMGNVGNVPD